MRVLKRNKIFVSLFLLFVFVLGIFHFPVITFAADNENTYSSVLDDLMKDESFNPREFPSKENDYSLRVLQIAESEKGELFLYVYQPSHYYKDLVASKINLSLQDPTQKNISYSLYDLELVSNNGVFVMRFQVYL